MESFCTGQAATEVLSGDEITVAEAGFRMLEVAVGALKVWGLGFRA